MGIRPLIFWTAVCLLALMSGFSAAQQPSGVPRTSELSEARADVLGSGAVVVTLTASGELKGIVTFILHPAGDGRFDGEWAFTVAHTDNTDPATGAEPPRHEHGEDGSHHPHKDFVTLVHRGSLTGAVSGASVTFDSAGAIADISAPLTITQGASEFEGAIGTGRATLGALTLFF